MNLPMYMLIKKLNHCKSLSDDYNKLYKSIIFGPPYENRDVMERRLKYYKNMSRLYKTKSIEAYTAILKKRFPWD